MNTKELDNLIKEMVTEAISSIQEKSVPEPYNRNSPPRRKMTKSQIAQRDKVGNAMLNNKSTVAKLKEKHGEEWEDYLWATASGIVLNRGE